MENEILDDFREETNTNYGKRAYQFFLIQLACFAIPIIFTLLRFKNGLSESIAALLFLLMFAFNILGIIYIVRSFMNKEKLDTQRIVGIVGNLLIFILWVSMILINAFELYAFMNGEEIQ